MTQPSQQTGTSMSRARALNRERLAHVESKPQVMTVRAGARLFAECKLLCVPHNCQRLQFEWRSRSGLGGFICTTSTGDVPKGEAAESLSLHTFRPKPTSKWTEGDLQFGLHARAGAIEAVVQMEPGSVVSVEFKGTFLWSNWCCEVGFTCARVRQTVK